MVFEHTWCIGSSFLVIVLFVKRTDIFCCHQADEFFTGFVFKVSFQTVHYFFFRFPGLEIQVGQ